MPAINPKYIWTLVRGGLQLRQLFRKRLEIIGHSPARWLASRSTSSHLQLAIHFLLMTSGSEDIESGHLFSQNPWECTALHLTSHQGAYTPKMAEKRGTILLTGANGGLGRAIVSQVVSTPELRAYHGLYTAREASTATALRSASHDPHHSHDILSLDLARLAQVRELAAAVNARVASGGIPPIRGAGAQRRVPRVHNADLDGGWF